MLRDKLSPGTKLGFLKSEKMLRFKLLYIHKSVSENVYVNNILIYGECYSILLAYIIYGWWYCHLGDIIIKYHYYCLFRLMLLPFNSIGRCYGQWIVADECHWGWCYCLLHIDLISWLMLLPLLWQMLLPLLICFVFGWCYCQCLCGRCGCHWGWCYCLQWFFFLGWCYCQLYMWQMLLPLRLMLLPIKWYFGRCYCQLVADVITTILNVLADGIAKWKMELPL